MSDQGMLWDDGPSLAEAREWLEKRRRDGVTCPCCGQYAKVYRRKLPSATARTMIQLYRVDQGREFQYLPPIQDRMPQTSKLGGYATFGHWWELMEQQPGERPDGSNRVGWWRLTDDGRLFVQDRLAVPMWALIYNGTRLAYDDSKRVRIREALGSHFDYRELMDA